LRLAESGTLRLRSAVIVALDLNISGRAEKLCGVKHTRKHSDSIHPFERFGRSVEVMHLRLAIAGPFF
jgi:hypothetical protein